MTIGQGASTYLGTMFDVGRQGRVTLGDYALVHGARIICDAEVTIGDYALISWNVVLMDSYRVPFDPEARRALVRRVPALSTAPARRPTQPGRPIRIGRGAWIGFDSCVLPGVTIGEGAVVGARSVVDRRRRALHHRRRQPGAADPPAHRRGDGRMAAEPGSRGRIIVFGILFWYPLAGRHLPVPALPAGAAAARLRPVLHRGLGPLGLRPGAERPVARRQRATSRRSRRCSRRTASPTAGRFAAAIPTAAATA